MLKVPAVFLIMPFVVLRIQVGLSVSKVTLIKHTGDYLDEWQLDIKIFYDGLLYFPISILVSTPAIKAKKNPTG